MQKNILLGIILFFSALQFCGEKEVSGAGKSVSFKNQNAVFANPGLVVTINDFLPNNDERAFAATCTEQYHRYCLKYRIERALNLPPINFIYPLQMSDRIFFQEIVAGEGEYQITLRNPQNDKDLWTKKTSKRVISTCEHENSVNPTLFYGTNSNDGYIYQLDLVMGNFLRKLKIGNNLQISSLLILPENYLAAASWSGAKGSLFIYNLNFDEPKQCFKYDDAETFVLAKLDEERFISGGPNSIVTVWEKNSPGVYKPLDKRNVLSCERANCCSITDLIPPLDKGGNYTLKCVKYSDHQHPTAPLYLDLGKQIKIYFKINMDKIIIPLETSVLIPKPSCTGYDHDFLQQKLAECEGKSPKEQRKILAPYPRLYETLFPQRPETMDEWRAKQKPFSIFDSQQNACLALIYLEEKALRGQSSKNNHANAEQSGGGGAAK